MSCVIGLALLVGLPAVLAFIGVPSTQSLWLHLASFGLLLLGDLGRAVAAVPLRPVPQHRRNGTG